MGIKVLATVVMFISLVVAPCFAAEKGDAAAGKKTYRVLCIACHGTSGKGDGPSAAALPTKPQNHTAGKHMNKLTDKYLFDFIKGGGASMGKSPLMPPWGGQLKDQEIRNVVSYIRSLAVPPYKPGK